MLSDEQLMFLLDMNQDDYINIILAKSWANEIPKEKVISDLVKKAIEIETIIYKDDVKKMLK